MDMMIHKRSYLQFNIRDGTQLITLGEEIVQLMDQQILN